MSKVLEKMGPWVGAFLTEVQNEHVQALEGVDAGGWGMRNSNKASVWESTRGQAGNGAGGEKRGREYELRPCEPLQCSRYLLCEEVGQCSTLCVREAWSDLLFRQTLGYSVESRLNESRGHNSMCS